MALNGKKTSINEVLAENVRLCERALDNQERNIESLNKRIITIAIFTISIIAYLYGMEFEPLNEGIEKIGDLEMRQKAKAALKHSIFSEVFTYIYFGITMFFCALGLWPISINKLDTGVENYKKYRKLNTYQTIIIEEYNKIIKKNEGTITLWRSAPVQVGNYFRANDFCVSVDNAGRS